MLETLMAIKSQGSCITSEMGILGQVAAYFGVVEAQGRGTLHLHMLMWLAGTPDANAMEAALQTSTFREKI